MIFFMDFRMVRYNRANHDMTIVGDLFEAQASDVFKTSEVWLKAIGYYLTEPDNNPFTK